jgi:uncharacterized protein
MTEDLFDVEARDDGADSPPAVVVRLAVQPGAGRSSVVGTRGDALAVRVAPPPLEGRANEAVIELLAEVFGVGRADVELVSGEKNRQKRVRVRGVDADAARRVLDRALAESASKTAPRGRRRRR